MSKFIFYIVIISICSLTRRSFAQNNDLRDNYLLNCLYNVNPAAAGYNGGIISALSLSNNWMNIKDAPSGQIFSNSIRLGREDFYNDRFYIQRPTFDFAPRIGVGLTIYNETSGPLRKTGISAAYAYHIPLKDKQLSFGLSCLYSKYDINVNMFEPIDKNDPKLYQNNKGGVPSFQIGSMFYDQDLIISLSMLRSLDVNKNFEIETHNNLNIFSLYKLDLNSSYIVEPSIMVDFSNIYKTTFDINLKLYYLKRYWMLISLRDINTISAGIGLEIKSNIQIQYNYRTSFSGFSKYTYGSQCIAVLFNVERFIHRYQ